MNGRMAKQIRKVAANPQLPEETKYTALQHKRTMYQPVYEDGALVRYEPVGVIRLQIVMDSCQRRATKIWKNRFKTFHHRSDTLPNPGLNVKHML